VCARGAPQVSDGIIAPGYEPKALEILRAKKGGAFIILRAKEGYKPPPMEYREVYGEGAHSCTTPLRCCCWWPRGASLVLLVLALVACDFPTPLPPAGMMFGQRRNDAVITPESLTSNVVTAAKTLSADAVRDLVVALIAIKYTQSNSVGYARDGQMVGVGAGQQSRVDCVKLAGRKVSTWYLRQHPKVRALKFKADVKRQARVNARVRYIEGDFSATEHAEWVKQFDEVPPELTTAEKEEWMATLKGVSLASDAFFPFRDSIDVAARFGVGFVAQPGGSVQDAEVTKAADEYGMVMAHNKVRLFHH